MQIDWIETDLSFRDWSNTTDKTGAYLVEFADGTQLTVGEVNFLSGVCDDCRGIPDCNVKRFAVLYQAEEAAEVEEAGSPRTPSPAP